MNFKDLLKNVKAQESLLMVAFGILIILFVGYLAVRQYSTNNKTSEVLPTVSTEESVKEQIHIVQKGESLWRISEKYYGTGYNWVNIKTANNLENADAIDEGQELIIPKDKDKELASTKEASSDITPTPTEVSGSYKVVQGDSLWKLAERYYNDGNKWTEISKANDLKNPSIITEGEELNIPNLAVTSSTSTENTEERSTYTVQSGDSLWRIAQGTYGEGNKWLEIAKANNLVHPSMIHAGNTLTIPR